MAVEARNLNLFRPQLVPDRELLNLNPISQANGGSAHPMRFLGIPSAAALPENQSFYQSAMPESVQAKTTDSGLTYNVSAPRKRSREAFNQAALYAAAPNFASPQKNNTVLQCPSFGGDILQQYQFEIDAVISQHTKKIRIELEERQKQQARLLAAAIGEGVMKKLKEKDEQIQKLGKLNLVLQERVKSLYVENQLWRDLAQSNEATANSLRTDLEQVLLHVGGEDRIVAAAVEDDAESCCGSSDHGGDEAEEVTGCSTDRKCKMCGDRESCVLLLPCRHLCLCSVCGSGSHQIQTCPVCNSAMNATLHVNMSP